MSDGGGEGGGVRRVIGCMRVSRCMRCKRERKKLWS